MGLAQSRPFTAFEFDPKGETFPMKFGLTLFCSVLVLLTGSSYSNEMNPDDFLGEYWYGLYINGQKSGYSRSSIAKTESGYLAEEDAQFQVTMMGVPQEMHILTKRTYAADGALREILSEVKDLGGVSVFRATVTESGLELKSKVGGAEETMSLPPPRESLSDTLKHAHWVRQNPAIGDILTFTLFEPMYKQEVSGISEIVGLEQRFIQGVQVEVYKITTALERLGIESTAYVTREGITVEDVVAGSIRMRLEDEQLAKDFEYSNDVVISNAVMVPQRIQKPRTRESLRLRLNGPLTMEHIFIDGRQRIMAEDDGFLFVSQIQEPPEEAPELPITDPELARWIESSTFVQSDDERIIDKAREIIGDESDSWAAAQLLSAWVSANVNNVFSARLTNALEVLHSLKGDCTEHSILFIALARAVGIPAREVSGLVYIDDGPGFYYHQWAKVWVGKWIDVDPTFDQPLADVTHIKLAEGDLFEQAKIMPIIGNLEIEVLPDIEETVATEEDTQESTEPESAASG